MAWRAHSYTGKLYIQIGWEIWVCNWPAIGLQLSTTVETLILILIKSKEDLVEIAVTLIVTCLGRAIVLL